MMFTIIEVVVVVQILPWIKYIRTGRKDEVVLLPLSRCVLHQLLW